MCTSVPQMVVVAHQRVVGADVRNALVGNFNTAGFDSELRRLSSWRAWGLMNGTGRICACEISLSASAQVSTWLMPEVNALMVPASGGQFSQPWP
jgi:hypothetical protein